MLDVENPSQFTSSDHASSNSTIGATSQVVPERRCEASVKTDILFKSLVHLIFKRHTLVLQDEAHSEEITAVGAAPI